MSVGVNELARVSIPTEHEDVGCALCGAEKSTPILYGRDVRRNVPGNFSVVRCQECGLAYINPRPTQKGISEYYPADYEYHRPGTATPGYRAYYRLFRMPPVPPGSRILDVGCGGGGYLLFLRSCGYDVAGVEPNAQLARQLHDELDLEIYPGLLTDAGLTDESFDAITFWWVLEHTHDPVEALKEAHRILKPGGKLVVAVPNFASLARQLFGSSWHHLDLPGHLYQFEPETLLASLKAAGFEPLRLRQDLIAKELAPSIGYRLGLSKSLDWWLPNGLALPFDLLAWCFRRSGLMTAYATRS